MMGHAFSGTDPKTVPIPHMKKYSVKRRKLEWDEVLMSSGVFAISKANRPKPDENRPAAMSERPPQRKGRERRRDLSTIDACR